MNISDIRNNHLLELIEKIQKGYDADERLITELTLANFICPSNDGMPVLFQFGECETLIPAYTSFEKFMKFKSDFEPSSWEFARFYQFLDSDVTGVIIDPEDCGFIVPLPVMIAVFEKYLKYNDFNDIKSEFTSEKLHELLKSKNTSLNRLVNKYPKIYLEDLLEELSKSVLFTFMGSHSDVSEYARDGIIRMKDVDTEGLVIMADSGMECGLIFTTKDYSEATFDYLTNQGRIVYHHIINLESMAKFIIELDLDALIINYMHQMIPITRSELLEYMGYIVELCAKNVKYNTFGYVFSNSDNGTSPKGYDVKVRLDDFRPLTWRDLIIPENITFKRLDAILQSLWGFDGSHLSAFSFKNSDVCVMDLSLDVMTMGGELDSNTAYIDSYFKTEKKIFWEYDFGDSWSFTIEIKKTVDYDLPYATIKRFKGDYSPVEDCGGVWGLDELIEYKDMDIDDVPEPYCYMVEELTEFDLNSAQEKLKGI